MLISTAPEVLPDDGQRAPYEYQEAVELWARTWGRHGHIAFSRPLACWVIHLTRMPGDPLLQEWQEGRLRQAEAPTESIPLHRFDPEIHMYRGIPLADYGPSGITEFLDRANTWSGRGENKDLEAGIQRSYDANKANRERMKTHAREQGKEMGRMARRKAYGLAFVQNPGLPETSLTTPTGE